MKAYVVLDLEMCKVSRQNRSKAYPFPMEIIQIGAVLLDETYRIADSFCRLVSPRYGHIDHFIEKLTGISAASISEAPDISEALQEFSDWLPEEVTIVTWSGSDQAQIRHELEGKSIQLPREDVFLGEWLDCQKLFLEKLHYDHVHNLVEALNLSGIEYQDGIHDGLVDAHNTALLFAKLQTEKEFQFSKYYQKEEETAERSENRLSFSFGDLLKGITLEKTKEKR